MILSLFRPSDMREMNLREDVVEDLTNLDPAILTALAELRLLKTVRSNDGKILGIIGAVPRIPGVCEVFLLSSKDMAFEQYKTGFAKQVKKEVLAFKSEFRRIQSISLDTPTLRRWHEFLGFEEEGTLKNYGMKGENMIMWGLT